MFEKHWVTFVQKPLNWFINKNLFCDNLDRFLGKRERLKSWEVELLILLLIFDAVHYIIFTSPQLIELVSYIVKIQLYTLTAIL